MSLRRFATLALVAGIGIACGEEGRTPAAPELAAEDALFSRPAHATVPDARNFVAPLDWREEVPEVDDSRATGLARFQLSGDGTALEYKLIVANIQNVLMAHIHAGPPGVAGPVVVWLYPSAPPPQLIPGRSQGILAEGTITEADFMGPLAGEPFEALLDLIHDGLAYVNVHTSQNPPGEIRGQIHVAGPGR